MEPTLPVYRFRVRERLSSTLPQQQPGPSRNVFFIPIVLTVILVVLAVASPPSIPHPAKWLSLSNLTSPPATASTTSSSSSSSSSSPTNYSPYTPTSTSTSISTSTSTSTSSTAFSSAAAADLDPSQQQQQQQQPIDTNPSPRSMGRRLQAASSISTTTDATSATDVIPAAPPPSRLSVDASTVTTPASQKITTDSSDSSQPSSDSGVPQANLAYFIQLSEATIAHLPRLLNRIYHSENVYAIHFDKKVDVGLKTQVKKRLFKANPKYEANVLFMQSELITYRGVSMLLNTINAMRILLDFNTDWHYFINISGADYPLISQPYLRELLGKYIEKPLNFFTFAPVSDWDSNLKFRLENIYIDDALSFQSNPGEVHQLEAINPLAKSMKLRYTNSEAWMINSRQFCKFVINSGYARKLLLTFAYSVESSEHYFATLIWNHPIMNRTIVNDAMRGVLWEHNGVYAGQHPYYVDEKLTDGKKDFMFKEKMLDCPTFFIRKFKRADSPLMDLLDAQWRNESHLKRVKEKVEWHVQVSMDEHKLKREIAPEVALKYGLTRRRHYNYNENVVPHMGREWQNNAGNAIMI